MTELKFAPFPQQSRFRNLTGRIFGQLSVIGFAGVKEHRAYWWCRCSCGEISKPLAHSLISGASRSCGCLSRTSSKPKHGHAGGRDFSCSPEYMCWRSMLARCRSPHSGGYKYYGARGIKVCDRWNSFEVFLEDMGPRPSLDHSIDRYPDTNGNYEPTNCRWATPKQQNRNTRRNVLVDFQGRQVTLVELSEITGIRYGTVRYRVSVGWPIEQVVQP